MIVIGGVVITCAEAMQVVWLTIPGAQHRHGKANTCVFNPHPPTAPPPHPALWTHSYIHLMQDEEQLKLSVQQGALLRLHLDESQATAMAAAGQVQHAEAQTRMMEQRMTTVQTQVEEQQAKTR